MALPGILLLPALLLAQPIAEDPGVRDALRAALVGDAARGQMLAHVRLAEERATKVPKASRLAENMAVLAESSRRPIEPIIDWKAHLRGFPRDASTKAADRLVRRTEPRQRFEEARSDRRYERLRSAYNGIAIPIAAAVQGQFFPLVTLPFRAVENLVVGRRFLTPEQRKELTAAARAREAFPTDAKLAERTDKIAGKWPAKRRNLSALQASTNAAKALRHDEIFSAAFWLSRQQAAQDKPVAGGSAAKLQQQLAALADARRAGTSAAREAAPDAAEKAEGAALVRGLLLADKAAFDAAVRRLSLTSAGSPLEDDMIAARAAMARQSGDLTLTGATLRGLAHALPKSPWGGRAAGVLAMPEYSPAAELQRAQDRIAERRRGYLVAGMPPQLAMRALTPEEARQTRQSWIDRAQALFLTDMLARALFMPFLPAFPRPELPDAAARVEPEWFETKQGRRWLARVAEAQRVEKRHEDAARNWERLGNTKKADSARQRAAKLIERQAEDAPRAEQAVVFYERLLNAYPQYRKRARVEKALADRRAEAESLVTVTRDELKDWPELRATDALGISETLLDGRKSNGEIAREGILVLRREAWSYTDRATGERREVTLDAAHRDRALELVEPLRRTAAVRKEIGKPLPRKRIPLAVEAGALPGFDVAPGLVPLEPDIEERELYQ